MLVHAQTNMKKKTVPLLADEPMVSYCNGTSSPHIRFTQFAKDPVPKWATDVQPYTRPVDIKDTTAKQAYEWVKTGHWTFKQFEEWYEKNVRDY